MLVADTYLGTRDDPTVAERLRTADPLTVVVDDTERRRSRFRTTAECGREVGVVVARDLDDGDVLDADGTPVVVRLEPIEALVVDFAGIDVPATTAVQVGHAVGNRHWSLAVRGEEVLLPVTDDRERMEAAVRPLLAEGADVEYAVVSPTTFDDAGNAHGGHGHDHAHPPLDWTHWPRSRGQRGRRPLARRRGAPSYSNPRRCHARPSRRVRPWW